MYLLLLRKLLSSLPDVFSCISESVKNVPKQSFFELLKYNKYIFTKKEDASQTEDEWSSSPNYLRLKEILCLWFCREMF